MPRHADGGGGAWRWRWLRLVTALSPGYIHPDEVFQSMEVMAATVFRYEASIPWEFADCTRPARSFFTP